MADLDREGADIEQQRARDASERARDAAERAARARALAERVRHIETREAEIRAALDGLDDSEDERAHELRQALEELEREKAEFRAETIEFERSRGGRRDREMEIIEIRRRRAEHDRLADAIGETDRELHERRERGEGDSEESRVLERRRRVLIDRQRTLEGREREDAGRSRRGRRTSPEGELYDEMIRHDDGRIEVRRQRRVTREDGVEGGRQRTAVQAESTSTRIYRLEHALGGPMAEIVDVSLRGQATVIQDERTNSLLVTGPSRIHARVERIIRQLDVPGAGPERREHESTEGLGAQVEELRGKVDGMHEQMEQMRKMLQQLLEREQHGHNASVQEMKEY
jgi:hypothetical protein